LGEDVAVFVSLAKPAIASWKLSLPRILPSKQGGRTPNPDADDGDRTDPEEYIVGQPGPQISIDTEATKSRARFSQL
jgi:hypothetical protein